jgi:hypothetical protein
MSAGRQTDPSKTVTAAFLTVLEITIDIEIPLLEARIHPIRATVAKIWPRMQRN